MDSRFEEGRTASPEALTLALATAPPPFIEGAFLNPALDPAHLLLALKNPSIGGSLIVRISRQKAWIKPYEVKAAIVLHPKTPRAVAMNLVTFLWWRDLVRVIDRAILPPPLRRTAERILSIRLQELAVGEKITLARIASRGLIPALRAEEDPLIIRALLHNPRLLEEDALAIACAGRTHAPVLRVLAEDSRFAPRPAVQKAIARHRQTPPAIALRIVQGLSTRDLKDLARGPRVPGLVKVAAQRLLEARRHPDGEISDGKAPPHRRDRA